MKQKCFHLFTLSFLLMLAVPAMAQNYEGTPVKSGQATFKFGSRDLAYNQVEGGIQPLTGGFMMATLIFKPGAKVGSTHLNVTLMYQKPGPVDLEGPWSASGIGIWWEGDISAFKKGKSKCTMTLTKATATEIEGTANCPTLHNMSGEVSDPLTNVKFSATTK